MKLRLAAPALLIDIGRLSDLSYVREDGDRVAIGALTRHRDLETSDVAAPPRAAAGPRGRPGRRSAGPPPRHHRRFGRPWRPGVRPAGRLPGPGRHLHRGGPGRERTIAATDFFRGFLETALEPDEVLTEISVPKVNGAGWSFQKFNRRAQDWAIVGVAAVRGPAPGWPWSTWGRCPCGPGRSRRRWPAGPRPAEAAAHAADGLDPPEDLNASPEYRRHLAQVLVRRALEEAGRRVAWTSDRSRAGPSSP